MTSKDAASSIKIVSVNKEDPYTLKVSVIDCSLAPGVPLINNFVSVM